jgi:hypothetical protein
LFGSGSAKVGLSGQNADRGDGGAAERDLDEEMHAAVDRFVFELKRKAEETDEIAHEQVVGSVLAALGNLGCLVSGDCQGTLLWVLMDSLVHPSFHVRAVAFDQLQRVARANGCTRAELVLQHSAKLYPLLVGQMPRSPELIEEVCEVQCPLTR